MVDDEPTIVILLEYHLNKAGFTPLTAYDGTTALRLAREQHPDLILLDVMLPDMDGLAVFRRLQREADIPVIFLTARDAEMDRIIGLELGADDYITKPFSPAEVVARIRAVLRRTGTQGDGPAAAHREPRADAAAASAGVTGPAPVPLQAGPLVVDPARYEARLEGRDLNLTPLEFQLLVLLMEYAGLVLTRQQILDRIWGEDYFGTPRLVDVHIRSLRSKLGDDPANPRWIETIRGVGYKFKETP